MVVPSANRVGTHVAVNMVLFKDTYHQMYIEDELFDDVMNKQIMEYMKVNPGILKQLEYDGPRPTLTTEILNNFIDELIMSRNRKGKAVTIKTSNEELIKSVFELYKPNKVQLFFLKAFGPTDKSIFTGNKKRVKQLSSVLNMTEEEIRNREMKLYLGFK
jgi:hypothetical protein